MLCALDGLPECVPTRHDIPNWARTQESWNTTELTTSPSHNAMEKRNRQREIQCDNCSARAGQETGGNSSTGFLTLFDNLLLSWFFGSSLNIVALVEIRSGPAKAQWQKCRPEPTKPPHVNPHVSRGLNPPIPSRLCKTKWIPPCWLCYILWFVGVVDLSSLSSPRRILTLAHSANPRVPQNAKQTSSGKCL